MSQEPITLWPTWRKILFRFFSIYLTLQIAPWTWLGRIPGTGSVLQYYYTAEIWAVTTANKYIFHIRESLVYFNGSGDTSYGWAQLCLFLSLAAIGCLIWSALDRNRPGYERGDYWLRTMARYFIAINAFTYGIIKLFALQMLFPNLSQLATPLGDFLPMRFSWMFMGYSTSYEMFAGAMETVAGLLLLYRRTATAGLLLGAGVFGHVVVMNLSYDIPVKIFSSQLFFYCVFLLAYEWKRLAAFFLNQPSGPSSLWEVQFSKRWMRLSRIFAKLAFIGVMVVYQFVTSWNGYVSVHAAAELKPIKPGIYDVKTYVLNGDTIPGLVTDTVRWRDVVFEGSGLGSVGSTDTLFRQRYRRGYFIYKPDTAAGTIGLIKRSVTNSETPLFTLRYEIPDEKTIRLWGNVHGDSLHVELVRSRRHFQLAERQFHWLSEYNR